MKSMCQALVAIAALSASGLAAAHGHRGVAVAFGLAVARPVHVDAVPVYVAPPPVYIAPSPVYYVQPPVVLVAPPPVYHRPAYVHYERPVASGEAWGRPAPITMLPSDRAPAVGRAPQRERPFAPVPHRADRG